MPVFDLSSYVDVQERIVRFWAEYPNGRIVTQLISLPDEFEQVVFRADVFKHRDNAVPDVTGWDAETKGSGGANNTSWHANCETSAIGRALANMGYAKTRDDRVSRQEMTKVARGNATDVVDAPPTAMPPKARPRAPERAATTPQATATSASEIDLGGLHRELSERSLTHDDGHDLAAGLFGIDSLKALSPRQLFELRRFVVHSSPPEIQARLDGVRAAAGLPGMPEPAGVAGNDQHTA